MYFSLLSAITLASAVLPALSVNTVSYASTVSCSGDAFVCGNLGRTVCCVVPSAFGFSAQIENIPSGSIGQVFTGGNGCTNPLTATLFGPGTKCWNGGGRTRATGLAWDNDRFALTASANSNATCVQPSEFRYTTPGGAQRTLKIPAEEGAAQKVADLRQANDFAALSAYDHE